jgi:hypothetical protein
VGGIVIKAWMMKPQRGLPLTGWSYRKSVTLSRASGAVSNYQMKLLIHETTESAWASPTMTSNSAPTPYIVAASSEYSATYAAWKAFDGDSATAWSQSAGDSAGQWLRLYSPTATICVTAITIKNLSGYGVHDFKVQGSNDASAWTDIYTGHAADNEDVQSFSFSNTVYYYYNRILFVTGYHVDDSAVTVVTMSGLEARRVACGGLCATDFDDIRFTKSDGTTLLDYWIESISGTTPNQIATIWIEFDSIGTGDTTFYMYYGNSGAAAVSNGANTFIVFDDFERGSDGDTVGGNWTEVTPHVHISTEQYYGGSKSAKLTGSASIPVTASENVSLSLRFKKQDAGVWSITHGDANSCLYINHSAAELLQYWDTAYRSIGSYDLNWHKLELNNFNYTGDTYNISVDDSLVITNAAQETDAGDIAAGLNVIRLNYAYDSTYFDNVFVRNWRSTEPAWGSWGAQES